MSNGDNSLGKTTAADGDPSKILAARDGGDGSGEASGNPIRTTGSLTLEQEGGGGFGKEGRDHDLQLQLALNAHGAGGEGDQGMREDGEKEETYGEEEEEEMLDFNLDEREEQAPKRWLALARFYSVQRYNINGLFEEMRKAWLPRHKVLRKVLHENLFLLEFLGEGDYKFVTSGGPWIHKGDALLVVPYDGRSRPSEVKLDSIPLWVQILDLPGALMNEEVGLKLGGRIGKALEVHKDDGSLTVSKYLRVKVAVPLAKPLKPWLEFKISGVPNKFDLKYEKVPHFCFKCGRMGHAEKECQFKGHAFEGFRYGEELRGSPYKRVEARTRTMEAMDKPQAARNLFCTNPLQLRKGARFIPEEQVHGEEEVADSGNVVGEANELASKVNDLQVKSPLPLAVAKNTQKRTQTGVLSASKSQTSTVKSIANSLNEKKGSPSQSGLSLSQGSDRNWKHRPSAALDEVTSPAKVDNKAVAVHRAFDSLKNYLAAAEGSKKEACLASEQTDVHMTPVSPLGKRNTTEAPLNPSGQQVVGHEKQGQLSCGVVAIKRLASYSRQGESEFRNEIRLIANLQHSNLVRLIGCCMQHKEKILVYEYMPNRSLDDVFSDVTRWASLTWAMRQNIVAGIAQGLLYLHNYSQPEKCIVHRDLKASNILLDSQMNPKISDFGIARMFNSSVAEAHTTRLMGTRGYMAPEYFFESIFSIKSDVFSFGVLVLEIISGRKVATSFRRYRGSNNLMAYAWRLWEDRNCVQLIDSSLSVEEHNQEEELIRCIQIALLCVQANPEDRPDMKEVARMLSNKDTQLENPNQPSYFDEPIATLQVAGSSNRARTQYHTALHIHPV
ncbi:hypothetical protein EJB05_16007, partial [Eragrostis curvula]